MIVFSIIFERITREFDLYKEICPRSERIKAKRFSIWKTDAERGIDISNLTIDPNIEQNCKLPKMFPQRLQEDLLEMVNDLRFLYGVGKFKVALSNHSFYYEMACQSMHLLHANQDTGLASNHVTQAGARCKDKMPNGGVGLAATIHGTGSGYFKAGYMLWNMVDEIRDDMGHRDAITDPRWFQTAFCQAFYYKQNYFPAVYFSAVHSYVPNPFVHEIASLRYSGWSDPDEPEWIAIPPPGKVDYTLIPSVFTFQSPKLNKHNVTMKVTVNGTIKDKGGHYNHSTKGYGFVGAKYPGVMFAKTTGYDQAFKHQKEKQYYNIFPYIGTTYHIEVSSDNNSWEYDVEVVDCENPPPPEQTPKPTPEPTPKPTQEQIQKPPKGDPGNNHKDGKPDGSNSKSKTIGLAVGIPLIILALVAGVAVTLFLMKNGVIGNSKAASPSDELGIDI